MLLDEPQHLGDRKRLLPSFHGDRMRDYGAMMTGVAERQIRTWPTGEPFELWPRMQAISLDVVMSAVFDELEPARRELLRERLVTMTDWINQPRRLALLAAIGKRSITNSSQFRHVMGEVEAVVLDEVRRRRTRAAQPAHDDIHSMLEREYGGEESHYQRKEDARRTRDDALRWPDRDLAGMGLRATAAPPRQARAAARGGARRRKRGVPRRGRQGDAAPLPGGAARDAPARRAAAAGRTHDPAGHHRRAERLSDAPSRRRLSRAAGVLVPSASWRTRPAPTRGFLSAAACAAASPGSSRSSR